MFCVGLLSFVGVVWCLDIIFNYVLDGGISKLVLGSIDSYMAEKLLSLKFEIQNDLVNMQ